MPFLNKGKRVQVQTGQFYGRTATVVVTEHKGVVTIEVDGILPDRSCLNRCNIKSHYLKVIN